MNDTLVDASTRVQSSIRTPTLEADIVALLPRVRTLPVRSFALIVVPMVAALIPVAYAGISLHDHAMSALVAERDGRAVRAAGETLADRFLSAR